LSETRMAGGGNGGVLKRVTAEPQCQVAGTTTTCPATPANCNDVNSAQACKSLSQNRVFVSTKSSEEKSWDLGGQAMPTMSTSYTYGQNGSETATWGDPTQVVFLIMDAAGAEAARKTTVNEYYPANTSNGNWILGRLKKASVTSTSPDQYFNSSGGFVFGGAAPVPTTSPSSMSSSRKKLLGIMSLLND
jgi:hypothetical protein